MNTTAPTLPINITNIEEAKYYFGSYLNMARHNIYLIIKSISDQVGIEDSKLTEDKLENAEILNIIKAKTDPDSIYSITNKLLRRFPFVENMVKGKKDREEIDPALIATELRKAFKRMNQLRNQNSHYYYEPKNPEKFSLGKIFTTAQNRIVKKFPSITEEDIKHLGDFSLVKANGTYTLEGLSFFICLFLEDKYASLFLSRLAAFKNPTTPSRKATIKCFQEYCCKLPYPRLESGSIELDMLGELDRCPKEIFMRLPKEKQNQFIASVDEEVLKSRENESLETLPKETEMKRNGDRFPYFALRYFDDTKAFSSLRFHFHLGKLRKKNYKKSIYGEERDRVILQNLRTFGRRNELQEQNIPKSWQDLYQGQYQLKETIEQFSPHYQISGNRIGIKFINPDTHIAFPELETYKLSAEERKKQFQPDAILSTYDLQNLFFYHLLHEKGTITTSPETFLQNYINQFHTFCKAVEKGDIQPVAEPSFKKQIGEAYDPNQKEVLEKRKEKLQTLIAPYGMKLSYLPDTLKEYLLGYEIEKVRETILRKLEDQIIKGKERLRLSKRRRNPKIGEMATYLAGDIIFLKPANDKERGKPNNQQYKTLQSSIAYFSLNKEKIELYFYELGLKGKDEEHTHPFLSEIKLYKCKGILDFYEEYINLKVKYLIQLKKKIEESSGAEEELILMVKDVVKINQSTKKVKNYHSSPVFIPRGLWNKSIASALKTEGYEVKETDSIVYGIEKFVEGNNQLFYNYDRFYNYNKLGIQVEKWENSLPKLIEDINWKKEQLESLKKKKKVDQDKIKRMKFYIQRFQFIHDLILGEKEAFDKMGSIDRVFWIIEKELEAISQLEGQEELVNYRKKDLKKFKQQIIKNEKSIRYTQANDRTLWLMIQRILDRKEGQKLNIDMSLSSLQFVGYDIEENILKKEEELSVMVNNKKITATLPIRRYGALRKFLKDRRLENLLKYYAEESIEKEVLESELDLYDRKREFLSEKIFEFEKVLFQKYEEEVKLLAEGSNHANHSKQLKLAFEKIGSTNFDGSNWEQIKNLRNKFSHNEIPFEEYLLEKVDTSTPNRSEQLIQIAIQVYENLITELKKVES